MCRYLLYEANASNTSTSWRWRSLPMEYINLSQSQPARAQLCKYIPNYKLLYPCMLFYCVLDLCGGALCERRPGVCFQVTKYASSFDANNRRDDPNLSLYIIDLIS